MAKLNLNEGKSDVFIEKSGYGPRYFDSNHNEISNYSDSTHRVIGERVGTRAPSYLTGMPSLMRDWTNKKYEDHPDLYPDEFKKLFPEKWAQRYSGPKGLNQTPISYNIRKPNLLLGDKLDTQLNSNISAPTMNFSTGFETAPEPALKSPDFSYVPKAKDMGITFPNQSKAMGALGTAFDAMRSSSGPTFNFQGSKQPFGNLQSVRDYGNNLPPSSQPSQPRQPVPSVFQNGMPSAKHFDDYLNQSLKDPNSSISTGLASMRAQSQAQTQSRMQNTRMNALAESVDPSATTMPMSASPFASNDFRQRLSSPYSGPADSRSIAQSGREVADNNYADLTRRSLGMDKDLAAGTKTQIDARVNNTLGRLETASNAVRNLGARAPVNSNSQWGNAGSPSVTQSPLAWNDQSLRGMGNDAPSAKPIPYSFNNIMQGGGLPTPTAPNAQTALNNAVTLGTGSGKRMLSPEEEELEAQMAKQQMPRQPVYGGNRITRPNQSTLLNSGIYGSQSSRATSPRPY